MSTLYDIMSISNTNSDSNTQSTFSMEKFELVTFKLSSVI